MKPQEAYDHLKTLFRDAALLNSTRALLGWDQRVMMPEKGVKHRAEQMAAVEGLVHKWKTAPAIGEWLAAVEGSPLASDPLSVEAVNIRWWRWEYDRETLVPQRLVEELARVTSRAEKEWEHARANSDYKAFKPWLDQVLALVRQRAQAISRGGDLYDALLDEYEPGLTTRQVKAYFEPLREGTVSLLNVVKGSMRRPDSKILHGRFPRSTQESFIRETLTRLGYDFKAGRLDPTVHPFETRIGPGDVRITTRYYEDFFNPAFFGSAHEAGHGFYEAGLPAEHFGSPMGHAVSLGVHESQSRMWENFVARGRPFWDHFFPKAQSAFDAFRGVSLDSFFFAINEVRPSTIRVEADELTYNLHILLRFDIEQELVRGRLNTEDLPTAWNERFNTYFGFTPPSLAEGVLQDVHWSGGSLGYFPTYTLGNIYAAQFFATAKKEMPDLDARFRAGDCSLLLNWLRENIHSQGRRYAANVLIKKVTGSEPSGQYLLDYLNGKLAPLYGF